MSTRPHEAMEIWLSGMICAALRNSDSVRSAEPVLEANPTTGGSMEPTNVTEVETSLGVFRVTVKRL